MDNMSFDNSFCASLQFCPSVLQRRDEVVATELFACNQSTIKDDDQDTPGDETFDKEWNRKGMDTASTIQLSNDDLNSFDNELRRAEC
jgi:hypothetical protein